MSILLDALKRAEQEKQAKQGTSTVEPPATPPPAPVVVPATLELEGMPAPAVADKAQAQADRQAASGVFTAKQVRSKSGKPARIALIAGFALLIIAGGVYFWWEWSRLTAPRGSAPWPPRVAARPPPQAGAGTVATGKVGDPAATGGVPPAAAPGPVAIAPHAPHPAPQAQAAEADVMNLLRANAAAVPEAPLKLSKSIEPPRIQPDVVKGYEALRRGDYAEARRSYEAGAAAEPLNADAQLGLGTIAARTGDRAGAVRHFRRALEIDPRNAGALAGLAAMADKSAPEQLERQLRIDIGRYPQSSALQMALGNLYASQRRWTEAQQAFFESFRLDPDNADAAYNLAVSLDHLGQRRTAFDYYQRSLAASQKQAVQFDRGLVKRRAEELKP